MHKRNKAVFSVFMIFILCLIVFSHHIPVSTSFETDETAAAVEETSAELYTQKTQVYEGIGIWGWTILILSFSGLLLTAIWIRPRRKKRKSLGVIGGNSRRYNSRRDMHNIGYTGASSAFYKYGRNIERRM